VTELFERRLVEGPRPGMRLGRHVLHDPRSRRFAVDAAPVSSLVSVRHRRMVKPFDQGDLGSCTGNACAGVLSTQPFTHRFSEYTAVKIYSAATALDPYPGTYPPEDTGSDGLSVAQVAKKRGWCSSYNHAFSLEAALTALQTSAVLVGITWLSGCDRPNSSGVVQYNGTVRGGHEIEMDEIDVDQRLVGFTNSWGSHWGVGGRFYMSWADLSTALSDDGDVTQLVA
jgi:hypothetical protein